jgi:hypothetical protein
MVQRHCELLLMQTKCWSLNLKRRDYVEELDINEKITLK